MRATPLAVGLLILGCASPARSQGAAPTIDPLTAYRQQALGARFSFWSGLRLVKGGAVVQLGFFGGGRATLFAGSEAALDSMDSYRKLRIAGTVIWATGLAVLIAELAMLLADREIFLEGGEQVRPLFWAMLVPAGVVGIAGGIMMQSANGYLSDAIQQYNDDLHRRLSGGGAGARRLMLSVRRSF